MRLVIACLIPCLNLLPVASAQDDVKTEPSPADQEQSPSPDQIPDETAISEENDDAATEELASLEEAARKDAEQEKIRLAKAAAARESAHGCTML